ncbi:MAG: hypothetical protein V4654_07545 [Bdellovibrionota bacterium]
MKLNMIAMALVLVGSYAAYAGSGEKTGDIGSATGKEISCTARTTSLDLEKIGIIKESPEASLILSANANDPTDERTQAENVFDLGNNQQVAISVVHIPKGSIVNKGEAMIMMSSRLQYVAPNDGKITVLAVDTATSDEGFLTKKGNFLHVRSTLVDPALATAAANQKQPMSAYGLLKAGLIKNGFISQVHVSCFFDM